jgi:hypothetical protein
VDAFGAVLKERRLEAGLRPLHAFGASGTPSAVLVVATGRIASEVGVGAPAVLGMAGASPAEP